MNKYMLRTNQNIIEKVLKILEEKYNCRFKLKINEYDFEIMCDYSIITTALKDDYLNDVFEILEEYFVYEDLWHVATTCDICRTEFEY